jgi:sn-glycerol 3-phosphate transport system substrate-binding protein
MTAASTAAATAHAPVAPPAPRVSRRRLATAGAALLGAGGLAAAGCGRAASNETASQAPVEPVTIEYWSGHTGTTAQAQTELAKRFNAEQRSVQVNEVYQGSYGDIQKKLTAAMAGGSPPDAFLMTEQWRQFWLSHMLSPLDAFVKQTKLDVGDFFPALYNEGIRNGKLWWVSATRSTPLFFYNKPAWREVGLPDRAPETWDEFVTWGGKLQKREGDRIARYAFQTRASAYIFASYIRQFGGRYSDDSLKVTIAEKAGVDAGQFFGDLIHKQQLVRYVAESGLEADAALFSSGQSASLVISTSQLAAIQQAASFPVGTGFLPRKVQSGVTMGGSGIAVPRGVPDKRAAAAFAWITFVTSKPSTTYWSQRTGYIPVRKSAAQSPEMQAFYAENPGFKVAVDQMPRAQQCDAAYAMGNLNGLIEGGLRGIFVDNKPAAVVFRDLVAPLEAEVAPFVQLLRSMK